MDHKTLGICIEMHRKVYKNMQYFFNSVYFAIHTAVIIFHWKCVKLVLFYWNTLFALKKTVEEHYIYFKFPIFISLMQFKITGTYIKVVIFYILDILENVNSVYNMLYLSRSKKILKNLKKSPNLLFILQLTIFQSPYWNWFFFELYLSIIN